MGCSRSSITNSFRPPPVDATLSEVTREIGGHAAVGTDGVQHAVLTLHAADELASTFLAEVADGMASRTCVGVGVVLSTTAPSTTTY
jgi:hypothetical protein